MHSHGAAQPGAAPAVDARLGIAFWISELLLLTGALLDLGGLEGSWEEELVPACLHENPPSLPSSTPWASQQHREDGGQDFRVQKCTHQATCLNLVGNQLCNRNWQLLLFSANHSSRVFHLKISQRFRKANYSPMCPFSTTIITI